MTGADEMLNRIEELEAKLAKAEADIERLRGVLLRISKTEPHHAGQTPNEYHFQKWAREALEATTELEQAEAETEDGRVFHPNQVRSSRVLDAEKLDALLAELRDTLAELKGQ